MRHIQGVPAQRVFWGKESTALCEIALCGDFLSTNLLLKSKKRGKTYFKVHFFQGLNLKLQFWALL